MSFISSLYTMLFGRIQTAYSFLQKKILMYQDCLLERDIGTVLESHKILL